MFAVETEITQLLSPKTVCVDLAGSTKQEALDGLLGLVADHPAVVDMDTVREDVWTRESLMSTGVGQGLGLPHAKTKGVSETVAAFAVTHFPVDFGAIDDRPVRLLFLLLSSESARSQHVKVLSRVSRLMNRAQIRQALLSADSRETVLEILAEGESELLDR